jgi:hypothetical protein
MQLLFTVVSETGKPPASAYSTYFGGGGGVSGRLLLAAASVVFVFIVVLLLFAALKSSSGSLSLMVDPLGPKRVGVRGNRPAASSYIELKILPQQHRIQLRKKPAGGMNRKAEPYLALGSVGYQQPLGHQLGQQISPGPLLQP